jgi:succinyl-CoA synthetase beta subunit
MQLYEYEGKQLFVQYGIPVPKGLVISSEALVYESPSFPVAIKPQVLAGGRGKAGAIRFANNLVELQRSVRELIGSRIKGATVRKLLIENRARATKELYLSILTDRNSADTLIMTSSTGGVNIEEANASVLKVHVNPLLGLQPHMLRRLISWLKLEKNTADQFAELVQKSYRLYNEMDALLVEINPLALLADGSLLALDSKISIDDYCISRHAELEGMGKPSTHFGERLAELGISGTELDGEIAIVASGAGCLMATLDEVVRHGGAARACVDLGGSVFNMDTFPKTIHGCLEAIRLLNPRVILLNAFFQLADCQAFAKAVTNSMQNASREIPTIVRLKGRFDDQVGQTLSASTMISHTMSFTEACRLAVRKSGEKN